MPPIVFLINTQQTLYIFLERVYKNKGGVVMKRVSGMLLLAMVILLSACSVQEKNNSSENNASNTSDQLVLLENKEEGIKSLVLSNRQVT